jgi:hypothetical protein
MKCISVVRMSGSADLYHNHSNISICSILPLTTFYSSFYLCAGMKGAFATRMSGSADLYHNHDRRPYHSINFVTAHDGFSLHDLVSYNFKHNQVCITLPLDCCELLAPNTDVTAVAAAETTALQHTEWLCSVCF